MVHVIQNSTQPEGKLPVVATEGYLKSKSSEYGWFHSANFLLPFFIEKKFIFKRLVFSHQTIVSTDGNYSADCEKAFLEQVVSLARAMGVTMIYQPLTHAVFQQVPDAAECCRFGSYIVDLRKSPEELLAGLHQKHRNVIRKAEKIGVEVLSGPEFAQDCFELIRDTMVRQSRPYVSLEQLLKYRDNLADNASFYIAKYNGRVCGCAVLLWQQGFSSYYLHGGSARDTVTGAMNFLHWHAMLDMKQKDVKYYDFVGARISPIAGSKQESMQRFKSRFGAEMCEGYLWKVVLRPISFQLYKLVARLNAFRLGQNYQGDIIDEESREK